MSISRKTGSILSTRLFIHTSGCGIPGTAPIDPSFYTYIRMWDSWYRSNVAKFHTYRVYNGSGYTRCRRHSFGGAKLVCEDMANLLLNERVKFTIGTPSEATGKIEDTVANSTYDFVKLVLNNARWWKLGNEYQERKAALGTVAYVPYLDNAVVDEEGNILSGDVKIAYFTAPNIYPITWENGYVSAARNTRTSSSTCSRMGST